MARADLLVQLAKAAIVGDSNRIAQSLEGIIAEEHDKNHKILADRLTRVLRENGEHRRTGRILQNGVSTLVHDIVPEKTLGDVYLSKANKIILHELIEENHRRELLQTYGISPRSRLMFVGPPGNGKTTLAEALAYELMLPLVVVRYEGLIGSFLGETASRMNKIFEYARQRHCVLFFDEFDVIGKERGDRHETGEIKRVVSSLLLQVDALPSRTIIVVASNHAHLLDKAAWRRFQVRIELSPPKKTEVATYIVDYQRKTKLNFGLAPATIATKLKPSSYAELEEFCRDVLRSAILKNKKHNAKLLTNQRIAQWNQRDNLKKRTQKEN
ncbi:AAA family ATPase [Candidatus Spongiihabitans sp.]|uniref:AAA family ATPase n=1 Tax=Candidatus Spongiihabitans sp. TaxID=3101308 RepID=UPI003C6EDC5D